MFPRSGFAQPYKRIPRTVFQCPLGMVTNPVPNVDVMDEMLVYGISAASVIAAPIGSPAEGQQFIMRLKDDGTARALSFATIYRASSDLTLPTTTVLGKTMYLGFLYNATDNKWDFVVFINNFT